MIPFRSDICVPFVDEREMSEIYEKIKTPYKYGAVVKNDMNLTDSPTVFQKDGIFYMYYISISKDCHISGYETHLARSVNLIDWEYIGPIFCRNNEDHWDSKQCAGYTAFFDIAYGGSNEMQKVNGSYYISYLAGNSDGYEPDPLYMGLSKSSDPTDPKGFSRFQDPILMPMDTDARAGETKTLYKSFLFIDKEKVTGFPYVNIYNAKDTDGRERIFLAVSENGEKWERYGDRPIIDLVSDDPDGRICGDPQIMKLDDIYIAFFFRFQRGKGAYNTFACSRDLIHWTYWNGEPLIRPEYEWENVHAHKTWFLRHGDRNYHFYCAVNDKKERFIALATS